MGKLKLLLILLVLTLISILTGIWFYFYQFGPKQIRAEIVKSCHKEATDYGYYTEWEPKNGDLGSQDWHDVKYWSKERYDEFYAKCNADKLRERGIGK